MAEEPFDPAWMARFQERVNADPEMRVVGDWFTVALSMTFGEARYVVRAERGRIVEVIPSPRLDVRSAFGLRAPEAVWRRFLSPRPEPLYHDFFAMLMRVPGFVLEWTDPLRSDGARSGIRQPCER